MSITAMMPMLLLQPVQMPPPRQVLGSGAAARAAMRLQPQLPTPHGLQHASKGQRVSRQFSIVSPKADIRWKWSTLAVANVSP